MDGNERHVLFVCFVDHFVHCSAWWNDLFLHWQCIRTPSLPRLWWNLLSLKQRRWRFEALTQKILHFFNCFLQYLTAYRRKSTILQSSPCLLLMLISSTMCTVRVITVLTFTVRTEYGVKWLICSTTG